MLGLAYTLLVLAFVGALVGVVWWAVRTSAQPCERCGHRRANPRVYVGVPLFRRNVGPVRVGSWFRLR